jgi:RNA polymerase sigma-70 factor (ECF subfamily)
MLDTASSPRNSTANDRFAEWSRLYGRAVRGYLLGMVRNADVADDLAQEVFFRAWQARDRYREQGTARAYLLRIADRLIVDRSRRTGREMTLDDHSWQELEPASSTLGPLGAIEQAEAIERLSEAMECLSDAQRRVLLLRFYGQFSFEEIASMVDCPLNTALSHCRRGLQALRRLLVEEAP